MKMKKNDQELDIDVYLSTINKGKNNKILSFIVVLWFFALLVTTIVVITKLMALAWMWVF